MDPALARLRIPPGEAGCPAGDGYCPDQELFERLVSELAVAITSPVVAPAHTGGSKQFLVGLSSTATGISATRAQWIRGSEGDGGQGDVNASPDSLLLFHRVQVRKGLPFGFEVGGTAGCAPGTSMWTFGGQLKLAIIEGFRSSYGVLPDVSLRVTWDFLVGTPQLSAAVTSADLVASKEFVLGQGWSVAPFLGGQLSGMSVASSVVDLTPSESAFDRCRPLPGREGDNGEDLCAGDASDDKNLSAFLPVSHARFRFVAGTGAEYAWLRLGASVMFDLAAFAPSMQARARDFGGDRVATHLAVALTAGAAY